MKKIIILFILLIMPISVNAAEAEIVMDADSNRIIHKKNENINFLTASTSKIMTALVALENGDIREKYRVGEEIKDTYGASLYLKKGEEIRLKDLLYGLLLRSGNDAASVIANNVMHDEKEFVDAMNKKAKQLGMKNTKFYNPHGLDTKKGSNTSTAYDMALLTKEAMKNKYYKKIIKTKKHSFRTNENDYKIFNKNSLLFSYKYCTGGKTGYTDKAGQSLVTTAQKDGMRLIIVTFRDSNRFGNHKRLYTKYFNEYEKYELINKYTFVVNDKKYKKYNIISKTNVDTLLKVEEENDLKMKIVLKNKKKVNEGDYIGDVLITKYDETIANERLYIYKKNNILLKLKRWLRIGK